MPFTLLLAAASAHRTVVSWAEGRLLHLEGHALVETYAVLTRLPGDVRVAPHDAVRLLEHNFESPLVLDAETAASLPGRLAGSGIAGGATYDALVALAAAQSGLALATRDARARGTYHAIGVEVVEVG